MLLPEDVRARLDAETRRLKPLARDVAWIAPANLHLTLKFLGAVDPTCVDAIVAALARGAAGAAPFDVVLAGLGAFPSPARPRVIWAGTSEGRAPLGALAGALDEALAGLGFPRETRAFSAHVTLGRMREPARDPGLAAALAAAKDAPLGVVRVCRVSLMRSELSPDGARYTELAGIALG